MSAVDEAACPASAQRFRVALSPRQAVAETTAVLWRPTANSEAASADASQPSTNAALEVQGPRGGSAVGAVDRPAVVLGHGAGSDVTSSVLCALGRGLAARGYPVAAFNFPYAEAGRRYPDPRPRLESAFGDAVRAVRALLGEARPVVLGGRSMGGRIASLLVAERACTGVIGLLLLAYPLHPAGRPERLRSAHWPDLDLPILFLQGDRDPLCDLELLERERAAHLTRADSRVHVLGGAGHCFAAPRSRAARVGGREGPDRAAVLKEVVTTAGGWLDGLSTALSHAASPGPAPGHALNPAPGRATSPAPVPAGGSATDPAGR